MTNTKTRAEMIAGRTRSLPLKWFDLVTRDGDYQHQQPLRPLNMTLKDDQWQRVWRERGAPLGSPPDPQWRWPSLRFWLWLLAIALGTFLGLTFAYHG